MDGGLIRVEHDAQKICLILKGVFCSLTFCWLFSRSKVYDCIHVYYCAGVFQPIRMYN